MKKLEQLYEGKAKKVLRRTILTLSLSIIKMTQPRLTD